MDEAQQRLAEAERKYAETKRAIDDGSWTKMNWKKAPELVLKSALQSVVYWDRMRRQAQKREAVEREWCAA